MASQQTSSLANEELFAAVEAGDLQAAQQALKRGANPNAPVDPVHSFPSSLGYFAHD